MENSDDHITPPGSQMLLPESTLLVHVAIIDSRDQLLYIYDTYMI
jgi:hypothetical protein